MVIGGDEAEGDPGIAVLDDGAGGPDLGGFGHERPMRVAANVCHDYSGVCDPESLGPRVRWLLDNAHHTVTFERLGGGGRVVLHMRSDAGAAFDVGDEVTFHLRRTRPDAYPTLVAIAPAAVAPVPGPR